MEHPFDVFQVSFIRGSVPSIALAPMAKSAVTVTSAVGMAGNHMEAIQVHSLPGSFTHEVHSNFFDGNGSNGLPIRYQQLRFNKLLHKVAIDADLFRLRSNQYCPLRLSAWIDHQRRGPVPFVERGHPQLSRFSPSCPSMTRQSRWRLPLVINNT